MLKQKTTQTLGKYSANVAVSWGQGFESMANHFARKNAIPIINELEAGCRLRFHLDETGWQLYDAQGEFDNKDKADFLQPFRLDLAVKYQARGKDPLLNAMAKFDTVLDMTAGWGADALHLASAGKQVLALERHAIVYALLKQAHAEIDNADLKQKLGFRLIDAAQQGLIKAFERMLASDEIKTKDFEVVYLDPMFLDKSSKRAQSKKSMRIMQRLNAAPCADNERALFDNAMMIAEKRVVVKRALKAPFLAGQPPQGSIKSKLLRYDLYTPFR